MTPGATRSAEIVRGPSTPEGTFGRYRSDKDFSCVTGELPWYGNAPMISCIPAGRYLATWSWSAAHGCNVYRLQDVPGRVAVEIHKGNLCGDKASGFDSDVLGCCLMGLAVETFGAGSIHAAPAKPRVKQRGVTASAAATAAFEKDMQDPESGEQQPFFLTIR